MKYYSEEASREFRELFEVEVLDWPNVATRRMFGCPSYQVRGRLFAFLVDGGVVLTQLRLAEREALQRHCDVEEFKAGERVVKYWVKATVEDKRDLSYVIPFARQSYERARGRALENWSAD